MENGLNKKSWVLDVIYMLPAFIFALSILLVRLHMFSMPMTDIYWSEATDTSTLTDVFNYWKAIVIMIAAGFAVIMFLVGYFKGSIKVKKSFLYIPALLYSAFVLLSFICSDYKYFALRGMSEHFEGTIVLLAYIMMVLYLLNVLDSERRLKVIMYFVLCITVLLGILGITQAVGNDFFSSAIGQKLMTPNYVLDTGINSWDMIDILAASGQKAYDFSFTSGEVYQTVYNINYVPLYLSLLIPVSAILFIAFSTCENKKSKILSMLFLVIYGLYLFNFMAANSASGYFGLFVIFIVALIVFHKYLKRWIKPIICLVVVLGLVLGITADRWLSEVKSVLQTSSRFVFEPIYADNTPIMEFDYPAGRKWAPVDYIETYDDYFIFSINNNELKIMRDNEHQSYVILDGDDSQLFIRALTGEDEQGDFEILDERFHDYVRLSLEKQEDSTNVVLTTVYTQWRFTYNGDSFKYRNAVGKSVALQKIEHALKFDNNANTHGRMQIWSTTIPMLHNYWLHGSGADTFCFVYPQNDYATLYSQSHAVDMNLVTDKAHNLYLQYWVNTGFLSLIAWLTLVGCYCIGAIIQFKKRGFKDFSDYINGGIFCGIIGFLTIAFFNDGSVNTMPMFYVMLGVGFAINLKDKWMMIESSKGKAPSQMPEI